MNQKVVDQRVIAIYFDRNRQVQRLANYGLQDGKIFDFISRTTQTSGQELSYLTPLFNLFSFNWRGPPLVSAQPLTSTSAVIVRDGGRSSKRSHLDSHRCHGILDA